MSQLMITTLIVCLLSATANAQWEGYGQPVNPYQNRTRKASYRPSMIDMFFQENGQVAGGQARQNGVSVDSTPGQNNFFDAQDSRDDGIDHAQELREHQEFTGFEMTDSQITNLGIADRQGGSAGGPGAGASGGKGDGPGGDHGDLATQSNNPVGGLWMLWNQNDMTLYEGPFDGKRIFNTYVFQPVLPVQITDKWRIINRPVMMVNSFEVPDPFIFRPGGGFDPPAAPIDPFRSRFGLGDTALIQWASKSPEDSKLVFGAGWNWMFPTASNSDLGTGKYSLGPSIVALYLGDKIITGAVMQQYWSFAGTSTREDVSFMDLQYIYRFRLNPMFSVGGAPNIRWDQITGKWTVPIGFGFDSMTMWRGKPARFGAELQYYVSHTGGSSSTSRAFDPEWTFRLYFSPIIQAPKWAKRGLFGGRKGNCDACSY